MFCAKDLHLSDGALASREQSNGVGDEKIGGTRSPGEAAEMTCSLRLERKQLFQDRSKSFGAVASVVGTALGAIEAPNPRLRTRQERPVARGHSEESRVMR